MQYEIKDTVGFPVMANVDTPLRKLDADGVTAHTVETILAGQRVGFSSGVSKQLQTATKGTITIIHLQDDGYGGGNLWADLSKVYFTTDFDIGSEEIKHSVKGSANFDITDKEKVTPKIVSDNNTTVKETRDKLIEIAKKGLDALGGKDPLVKESKDLKQDDLTQKGIEWQPIIKWGLIGLGVVGTICLIIYLVKDKPDIVNQAVPKNDVITTLQGVNIPIPKNLT